jgi:hypothetical protein
MAPGRIRDIEGRGDEPDLPRDVRGVRGAVNEDEPAERGPMTDVEGQELPPGAQPEGSDDKVDVKAGEEELSMASNAAGLLSFML